MGADISRGRLPASRELPTATQAQSVRQSTPNSVLSVESEPTAGVDRSVQDAPSHVAANVVWVSPTAVQEVALKQLMLLKPAPPGTSGSPITAVQADPFQVWPYSEGGCMPVKLRPTAVQDEVPTHETPA